MKRKYFYDIQKMDILMNTLPFPKEIIKLIDDYDDINISGIGKYLKNRGVNKLNNPSRMTTDGYNIYVCDGPVKCIKIYENEMEIIYQSNEFIDEQCIDSFDLVIYDSRLYACDTNGKIIIFTVPDLKLINYFICEQGCSGIDVYMSKIYICDPTNIRIYDIQGKILQTISRISDRYSRPFGIFVDENKIYLCDRSYCRIMTIDGKLLSEFPYCIPNGPTQPKKVVVIQDHVYFNTTKYIYQYKDGQLVKTWCTSYNMYGFVFLNTKCYVTNDTSEIAVFG